MIINIAVTLAHLESARIKMSLKEYQGRSASICATALAINDVLVEGWAANVAFQFIGINHADCGGQFITVTPNIVRDFEIMFDDLVLHNQMHDDIRPYEFEWELPYEFMRVFQADKLSVSEVKRNG